MSEIVEYHRKYRPSRLSEYIGNKGIINSALKFLSSEHKPQVILLHGHSGCGKTTFARLLCSCYSCEHPLPSGDACGECDTCKEFAHYIETGDCDGLMDIKEVDTTDDNGKKAVEELIDDMSAPSLMGNWKCYIFDECHLLTPSAQARLLKTIEEPPEKVLICLCTTNPEKLLETIVSRCHYSFRVQKPKRAELIQLLQTVCLKEGVRAETKGLSLVATKGELVPRKSLIALQSVVRECGEVTYENAAKALHVIADKYYFTFYKLLLQATLVTYTYIKFINEISEKMSLSEFLDGLIAFTMRGVYVYNNVPVDGLDESELKPYSELFSRFKPGELVFMMDYLTGLRGDPDLEIKLLRLGYTGIKDRLTALEGTMGSTINTDGLNGVNSLTSAASDVEAGSRAFHDKTEITETEKSDIVSSNVAPVPVDDMLNMFQGLRVKMD